MKNKKNDLDVIEDANTTDLDEILAKVSEVSGEEGLEINGRIYRILPTPETQGRMLTEMVGKVDEIVDEDFVGKNFGSGRYRVRYTFRKDGEVVRKPNGQQLEKIVLYTVGREYDKFVKPLDREPVLKNETKKNGGALASFLDNLTLEKVTAISAAIEAFKKLTAPPPPPPQPDWASIIQAFASLNRGPSMSDNIVIKAMDTLQANAKEVKAAAPQKSLLDQLREAKELKDAIKEELDDEEDEDDRGNMNLLLKTALEYLPMLLKANGNDYKAVGQQAAANPIVQNMVKNDPELAKMFFARAVNDYGEENAKKLAEGFGCNFDISSDESDAEGN